ncbi:cupin domain-containing protein [Algoriphagus sp.]|uniref:cupin domain-containing protein n=1 Tax=Algoriphagus sp. TaxID=1872435 RepID=UPI0025FC5DD5|nr:cupin domain-containing protein [Algoriphagus sp.]
MKTQERVNQLVLELGLLPHPEGGFYKETYRSASSIKTPNGERNLSTVIYFLLTSNNVSKFHRIQSDEHWFWHEGSPLTIHVLDNGKHHQLSLGPLNSSGSNPQHLVQAKKIFGSSVDELGSYALVSCVVSPGFDFKDFELFSEDQLFKLYPNSKEIIKRLT